jgi:glycosyltransferase involved in cell wall biosynthesis
MQAGIDFSKGEVLVFMDADMQNDPRDIPRLITKVDEGYDLVSGWRNKRYDSFFTKRLPSLIANFLISKLSKVYLHDYGCTLKAYRREVIKQVRLYGEMHRFIPIYIARKGGAIAEIKVSHRRRLLGNSKYNLLRIWKVVLDFIVAEFVNNYLTTLIKPRYS